MSSPGAMVKLTSRNTALLPNALETPRMSIDCGSPVRRGEPPPPAREASNASDPSSGRFVAPGFKEGFDAERDQGQEREDGGEGESGDAVVLIV